MELDPKQSDYHMWLSRLSGTEAQKASMAKQISLARRLGAICEAGNRADAARIEYQKALALDPRYSEAKQARAKAR